MDADETVEESEMLSEFLRMRNRLRLLLPVALVAAVRSVSARLTSLPIARALTNGADGGARGTFPVEAGRAREVEEASARVGTGAGASTTTGVGVAACLLSFFFFGGKSLSGADEVLKRLLNGTFLAGGAGAAACVCDSGDGLAALAALAAMLPEVKGADFAELAAEAGRLASTCSGDAVRAAGEMVPDRELVLLEPELRRSPAVRILGGAARSGGVPARRAESALDVRRWSSTGDDTEPDEFAFEFLIISFSAEEGWDADLGIPRC